MSTRYSPLSASQLEPAEKLLEFAIRSWNPPGERKTAERPARVFVTVCRQPGAGAISFSHKLTERLNQHEEEEGGQKDWSAWDRELVQKVSEETGVAKQIIEMMPNRRNTWLDDLLRGVFANENPPDAAEIRAYKQMLVSVHALAKEGHTIIVGQGGTFITQGMTAAIHLRLVAPIEHRTKYTAERENISLHDAGVRIAELDRKRRDFYHRYWPGRAIAPETFTMTLNSAELSMNELVESVLPLIRLREAAAAQNGPREAGLELTRASATLHA